jgi:hypothetical protein
VAVCVLVIIVLGVGFFILSQILGGGREVANATDAGVLNVARRALSPTLIQVPLSGDSAGNPTDDFLAVGIDPSGNANVGTGALDSTHRNISMLGLNRVIAQAVIVACNAQEINTTAASGHAQNVAAAAKAVATQLKNMIQGGTKLPPEFTNVAHSNNTKMFQGNKVTLTSLQTTFLRPGLSTNVYISPGLSSAISVSLPSNLKANHHFPNALKHDLAGNDEYMAGYINFSIPAGPNGPVEIAGVPIFPKQKPHLVDIGEFNAGASPAGVSYLPPNAFRANSQTLESNSSGFGGAVACALVGALDQDFAASVPRGYIRIKNGPDAGAAHSGIISNPVVDGQNDVFNNELWPPNGGGVDVTNNGVYALNSNGAGQSAIADWAAFNNGTTSVQPPYPPPAGVSILTGTGDGFREPPTLEEMQAITSVPGDDCDAVDGWDRRAECRFPADAGATAGDGSIVTALQNQYHAGSTQAPSTSTNGYTAVEVQKHDLLSHRYGGGRCASVVPIGRNGATKYGMKKFEPSGCYATPHSNVAFGAPGSPFAYLQQIGNNGWKGSRGPTGTFPSGTAAGATDGNHSGAAACQDDIIERICKRIRQVDPQITKSQVETALASQSLELGETLYLHCPGPNTVTMVSGTPADYFNAGIPNDGASSAAIYNCENQYNISNTIINANKGSGSPNVSCGSSGDANFHQAPFTAGPGFLPGIDRAVWTPNTGWRNLLGEIEFQNEAGGAGTFCKPN